MDINKIREEFPIFKKAKEKFIYFDNATTTLKHQKAIDAINEFMSENTTTFFNSDFSWSRINDKKLKAARSKIAKFMGCDEREVIFSFGATSALINIAEILKPHLKEDDEILINSYEHIANHYTWLKIAKETKAKVKIIKLNPDDKLCDVLEKHITSKTKIIPFAATTNSAGIKRDVEKIAKICRKNNIISVVDGAQHAAYNPIECQKWDIDFFVWGPHKLYSSYGIGIMFGKHSTLEKFPPQILAGGSINTCSIKGELNLKPAPFSYQYGTQNIPAIIAVGEVCQWVQKIGVKKIGEHIFSLRSYALEKLAKISTLEIYNAQFKSSTILFNFKGIAPQDVSDYLGRHNIATKSGDQCAKLNDIAPNNNCVRISFGIYNTKEEVDILVNLLNNTTAQHIIGKIIGE